MSDATFTLMSTSIQTPSALARAMVDALGDEGKDRWLDPCVGDGAFVSALHTKGVPRDRITAIDLNPVPQPADRLAKTVRGADFIEWSSRQLQRFDKIVANPPYSALSRLHPVLEAQATAIIGPGGECLTAKANYWCAFILASLHVLSDGGSICFVLPAAYEYADYARTVRAILSERFESFEVHRSSRPLFSVVADGCVVICAAGYRRTGVCRSRRFLYPTAAALIEALGVPRADNACSPPEAGSGKDTTAHSSVRLGDLIDVSIGAVTGDARFFLMSERNRIAKCLPLGAVLPVVSRASHLAHAETGLREWRKLREKNERVWLFSPSEECLANTAVQSYLEEGASGGTCGMDGYKVRQRVKWFQVAYPENIDGFVSGMSHYGPWISLCTMRALTATNTLYVIRFREKMSLERKASWCLSLLSGDARSSIKRLGRRYPQGLLKFEPVDLLKIPVPRPPRVSGARETYRTAVTYIMRGRIDMAQSLAERWLLG